MRLPTRTNIQKRQPACQNNKTIQKVTHLYLTKPLIVTSPLESSMPAAEAWETTNADAFSVAPVVADIRNASALQWWSWNAPPSMIQAVRAITSPPQENSEENIPAQTHMVT